ncbi:hypothetical protein BpHYR1_008864 [Brachionus plicatilis]|uniref:EGF-like domain-containing protein n=1 Tax=Brachionus plicatilis TaxID=10195 RepID=A0A3M7Q0R4_BRAPC|nr:hypothetical protein BpHYR1_008864 [Brachionus plicatilis]
MKILHYFLLICLSVTNLKCVLIKIEFKLVKNSSDTDLSQVLDYFTRLKKTTEIDPYQNVTVESFLFWNKFIDLANLDPKNQTKEDQVLKQLIEISPFKDLIENLKNKQSLLTTEELFSQTLEPLTSNSTFDSFNSTWLDSYNASSSYTEIINDTQSMVTSPTSSIEEEDDQIHSSNKTNEYSELELNETITKENVIYFTKLESTELSALTTTYEIEKSTNVETFPVFPSESKILTTISSTYAPAAVTAVNSSITTLFSQQNLTCPANFCQNFGTCYLNYALEATCKCLDYRLMFHNLMVYYYSGKYCEKISYSLTQRGLFVGTSLIAFVVFALFLCRSCVKECLERGKKSQVKRIVECGTKNECYEPEQDKKCVQDLKSDAKNSWKYIKMNCDFGKKYRKGNKNHHVYIKKKIKYKIGSRTINKKLNASLPNIFPSAPTLSKDSFSLSLTNLDALCCSNVGFYPKPSRNLNGNFPPNQNEKEITKRNTQEYFSKIIYDRIYTIFLKNYLLKSAIKSQNHLDSFVFPQIIDQFPTWFTCQLIKCKIDVLNKN